MTPKVVLRPPDAHVYMHAHPHIHIYIYTHSKIHIHDLTKKQKGAILGMYSIEI